MAPRFSIVKQARKLHRPFSYCTASPIRNSHRLLAERLLKDVLNHSGLDFAGLVIKRGAMCVQYEDMRDIAFVVLLHRPPRLPLRVKASFAVDDDVIGLTRNKSRLRV